MLRVEMLDVDSWNVGHVDSWNLAYLGLRGFLPERCGELRNHGRRRGRRQALGQVKSLRT